MYKVTIETVNEYTEYFKKLMAQKPDSYAVLIYEVK